MADKKRRRRRSRGRYIKGAIDETLDLGTLASKTLIANVFDETVEERTRVSSIDATWSLADFTPGAGDGPILCGVAHSDYSAAEIEEVIENTGSWTEGSKTEQEIAKRLVRIVGVFTEADAAASINQVALNDGLPIKTKLNWILNGGDTLKVFAYNMGDSALATTDPDLHVYGHANLWAL